VPPARASLVLVLVCACAGRNWQVGPSLLAPDRQVARALGDDFSSPEAFDEAQVPDFPPPTGLRPCCAFGMDLPVEVSGTRVPLVVPNVRGVADLGGHAYDNGPLTFDQDLNRLATLENNGLIYTCRGGFVDTAHVRDYADLTLYLTMRIARGLPRAQTLTLPADGAVRTVALAAVPPERFARLDRWRLATALAQRTAFLFSIWHEIASWYGYQSLAGFSEKVSAFSPEDLYSNAVGIHLAGGVVQERGVRSRSDYAQLMNAWVPRTLEHLGAVPLERGRATMKALDGAWWDSRKTVADWTLVTRRNFGISSPVVPWRVAEPSPAACGSARALPLGIPAEAEGEALGALAVVTFEVGGWAPADFPFRGGSRAVTEADLPRLGAAVREAMGPTLGPRFDRP